MARRKIVLATGVFDLLHTGHVKFLEESKRRGGPKARLVVVVASDKTVLSRKGRTSILPENQRTELVGALRVVDRAILGSENLDMLATLRRVRPDIITVGYDQQEIKRSLNRLLQREELDIPVIQIPRYGPSGLNSSSKVKNKVAEKWRRD
jgi:FAD synthetase